ncbi:MAG: hypothetical protein H6733_04680 [Alphaproteobacteria bacterium]|nr:hypothetical protein [Alphaproteobacteria bacterium]
MSRTLSSSLSLMTAACVGAWLGHATSRDARAQEPTVSSAYLCHTFKVPLDEDFEIATSDKTSAIGQWVDARQREGWVRVASVDLETAQKANGYAEGFAQVCLARP